MDVNVFSVGIRYYRQVLNCMVTRVAARRFLYFLIILFSQMRGLLVTCVVFYSSRNKCQIISATSRQRRSQPLPESWPPPSRQNWLEVMVVVDGVMAKYHGEGIRHYVLTLMHIVSINTYNVLQPWRWWWTSPARQTIGVVWFYLDVIVGSSSQDT